MADLTFYSSISQSCFIHKPRRNANIYGMHILQDADLSRQFDLFSDVVGVMDSIVDQSLASFYQNTVNILEKTLSTMTADKDISTVVVSKNGGLSDVSNFWEMFHGFCTNKVSPFTLSFESLRGTATAIAKAFNHQLKCCPNACLPPSFDNIKDLGLFSELNCKQPIVVVVRDLESCDMEIFIYLVRCFHALLGETNIMLVLGISTPVEDALQHIPAEIIRLMNIRKLTLPPTVKQMSKLFLEVFFESNLVPVKLGPKVASFLVNHFLDSDLSVKNFFVCFKYCVFDHYFSNALARLCLPLERHFTKPNLSDAELLKLLKSDPSLQISSIRQFSALIDEERSYNRLLGSFINFFLQVRTKIAFSGLPSTSFVLYEYLTDGGFIDSPTWLALKSQLGCLFPEQLTQCVDLLSQCLPSGTYQQKLESSVLDQLNDQENIQPDVTVKNFNRVQGPLRVHKLKAQLAAAQEAAASPFERARKAFIKIIEDIIIENFSESISARPLGRIYCYNKEAALRDRFCSANRLAVSTALQDPSSILACQCCGDISTPHVSLPDTSTVYLLHAEMPGSTINLYDWMCSYFSIVDEKLCRRLEKTQKENSKVPEGSKRSSSSKVKIDENDKTYVRFLQAIANLQFAGYIKCSKRKSDYVSKLTWNGV